MKKVGLCNRYNYLKNVVTDFEPKAIVYDIESPELCLEIRFIKYMVGNENELGSIYDGNIFLILLGEKEWNKTMFRAIYHHLYYPNKNKSLHIKYGKQR